MVIELFKRWETWGLSSLVLFVTGLVSCTASVKTGSIESVAVHSLQEKAGPIASVDFIDIRGNRYLIYDGAGNRCYLYANEGKCLRTFYASDALSDSLVLKGVPHLKSDTFVLASQIERQYHLTRSELESRSRIVNLIGPGYFISDSEEVFPVQVYAYMRREGEDDATPPIFRGVRLGLLQVTGDASECFTMVKNGYGPVFAQLGGGFYDKGVGHLFLSVRAPSALSNGSLDSVPILAEYSLDGNYLGARAYLPLQCRIPRFGYNLQDIQLAARDNEGLVAAYGTVPEVLTLPENKLLPLVPVDTFANTLFFNTAARALAGHQVIPWDSIIALRKSSILSVGWNSGAHRIRVAVRLNSPEGSHVLLQEYGLTGDLISSIKLPERTNWALRYLRFIPSSTRIALAWFKPETGWEIEEVRWND